MPAGRAPPHDTQLTHNWPQLATIVVANGVRKAQVRRTENEHTHIELLECGYVHFSNTAGRVKKKVWGGEDRQGKISVRRQ